MPAGFAAQDVASLTGVVADSSGALSKTLTSDCWTPRPTPAMKPRQIQQALTHSIISCVGNAAERLDFQSLPKHGGFPSYFLAVGGSISLRRRYIEVSA